MVSSRGEIILTPWLMEPGGSMLNSQGHPIIPILSRINPIPCTDIYFFKIHSNIFLPSTPRPSSLLVKILK